MFCITVDSKQTMKVDYTEEYGDETIAWLADEFPHLGSDLTYLDHMGSTLYSASQLKAVMDELGSGLFCNTHTPVMANRSTKEVSDARVMLLRHFGCDLSDYSVVFTSGATAGLKIVGETFSWSNESELVLHKESHTSMMGVRGYASNKGAEVHMVNSQEMEQKAAGDALQARSGPSLVCYPAMSNFCGRKFPLSWVSKLQNLGYSVLLDTAALVGTNDLNIGKSGVQPDFLVISFYKMFGYPTGLGALLIKKGSEELLSKTYFGGGTVETNLVDTNIKVDRKDISERFEDGTLDFLGIASLKHGFKILDQIPGGMESVSIHTHSLARYTANIMYGLRHHTGSPVVRLNSNFSGGRSKQGGVVNFSLLASDGRDVGYSTFSRLADEAGIVVRTGCFCNQGACQVALGLTDDDTLAHHKAGHVCGDMVDMVGERPTGSIRVSFGYMSSRKEAENLINFVIKYFVETEPVNEVGNDLDEVIKLVGIYVYPVKSCGAMVVDEWPVGEGGLKYDRQWMVMHGDRVLTQKKEPLLALVRPKVDLVTGNLTLTFPGEKDLIVKKSKGQVAVSEVCIGSVCGEKVEGVNCGEEASDWLETVLGVQGLRLVRGTKRQSSRKGSGSSLANDSDCVLLNLSSVNFLAQKVKEECHDRGGEDEEDWGVEGLTMRFRGNLVVKGVPAFKEESWSGMSVGGVAFLVQGSCRRCKMITVGQESAIVTKEPLRTLASMKGRNFNFGVHTAIADQAVDGVLKVGDLIEVIEKTKNTQ